MDLSIVIPAKNEAGNIAPLVREIRTALDDVLDYELIYVDDGSKDATRTELRALRADGFARLRLLCHRESCGQTTAIHSGVSAARARWIATLDADGQNDPADIPALWAGVQQAQRPPALIAGYRRNRRDNWNKRLSSRVANTVRSRLLRDHTPDTGCGLKLFSRAAFLELPYFDHMHRFLPALMQRAGHRVEVVEVNHRPRLHGRTKYNIRNRLWVGVVDLCGVAWLQRRMCYPDVSEDT
jgi:dolichol-phosphate mannosyltransferase